jgi:hypothetical protein
MPHTRVWDVTSPPGSQAAAQIDDEIRKLRVDIDERMNELAVNWGLEPGPIDLKPQFKGNVVGKKLVIPFPDFMCHTDGKETRLYPGFLQSFTDSGQLYASIKLSPGSIITLVELLVDKGDATSVDWDVYSRSFAAGSGRPGSQTANVSLSHKNIAGAGVVLDATAVLAITVLVDQMYYIGVDALGPAGNSFDFYGARVTYDTPDTRNLI